MSLTDNHLRQMLSARGAVRRRRDFGGIACGAFLALYFAYVAGRIVWG